MGSKPNITVALAQDSDGEDVQRLVTAVGFEVSGLDWSNIYPHWLAARIGERIVGCIEVLLGRPFGRLEHLAIDQDLDKRDRVRVLRSLIAQGMTVLNQYGADMASSMVPFEAKDWKKILKKHYGSVVMASGNILATRV